MPLPLPSLFRWLVLCGLTMWTGCSSQAADGPGSVGGADVPTGPPVTVAEATKMLDLSTFSLIEGAEAPRQRNLAGLFYDAPGDVEATYAAQKKRLTDQGWTKLAGAYVTKDSASGTFAKAGHRLSLSVSPTGEPGQITIMLMQHGNVALDKLPVPADAKPSYGGPSIAMFVSESPVEKTRDECRKLLLAAGWTPYGTAGDSLFMKQNAVRLTANVAAAPAQGGKTMISYSSELMSADIPAPADAIGLQYSGEPAQLFFDLDQSTEQVVDFFRRELGKTGWESTTEKPVQDGAEEWIIFRSPAKDLLTVTVTKFKGKSRVLAKFETAAQVAEMERRIKEKIEKDKAETAQAQQPK